MAEHETLVDPCISTALCLCAGFGGLERGARLFIPGLEPVCCVEWEAFATEKLAESMEKEGMGQIPIWSDLRTFDGAYWRGAVDWVIAGFPCQPFSLAGSRLGEDDPRHLWPHVARIIGEVEPDYVFLENVPGILTAGKGTVLPCILHRLQAMGYEVAQGLFTAEEVGASHKRERVFILGVKREVVNNFGARREKAERFDIDAGQESSGGDGIVADSPITRCTGAENTGANSSHEGAHVGGGVKSERTGPVVAGSDGTGRRRNESVGGPDRGAIIGRDEPELANNNVCRRQAQGNEGVTTSRLDRCESEVSRLLPLFPPGPDDWDAWLECLLLDSRVAPAQSKVHLLADGLADDRASWLKLTGNGVVNLQAAYALATLWAVIFHGQ